LLPYFITRKGRSRSLVFMAVVESDQSPTTQPSPHVLP